MGTTPSDRVQLIGRAQLMHPGCCALCGSGNCEDGYVDTGIYFDYEGQVYFCMTCALQIAEVIGALAPDQHAHLQELLTNAAFDLSHVIGERDAAVEQLRHYDAIMSRLTSASDSGANPASVPVSKAEQTEPESTDGSTVKSDGGEPVAKEPVKGSGRRVAPRTKQRNGSTPDSGFTN